MIFQKLHDYVPSLIFRRIFTYYWYHKHHPDAGKYTSPMDPIGIDSASVKIHAQQAINVIHQLPLLGIKVLTKNRIMHKTALIIPYSPLRILEFSRGPCQFSVEYFFFANLIIPNSKQMWAQNRDGWILFISFVLKWTVFIVGYLLLGVSVLWNIMFYPPQTNTPYNWVLEDVERWHLTFLGWHLFRCHLSLREGNSWTHFFAG